MDELRKLLEESYLAASYAYSKAYRLRREGQVTKSELRKIRTVFGKAHALWQNYGGPFGEK